MEYRFLGDTGVQVSELCLGTWSFGGEADENAAEAMFHRSRDVGINIFDCADVYQDGQSEEILGRLIAGCRDEVVITSKVYFPAVTAPLIGARSLEQLESSLKAAEIRMTPALRAEIAALSPAPPPATDRNKERTSVNDYGVR